MAPPIYRLAALAVIVFGLAAPAGAATLPYSGIYAFGDSLTDKGNAYRLSLGFVPESPPYYRGRFSDGPIWYDSVAAEFRDQDLETSNYAVGGARAVTNRDLIPDLWAQRRTFIDRADHGPDALAAVFAGGNDLLARIGRARLKPGAAAAADAVIETAASLHRRGIDTALIFNLPNFADIPRFANSKPAKRRKAAVASRTFNARLARGVTGLRADGIEVIEVDTYGLFADVVANPGAYGIDNVTKPCLVGDRNTCSAAEARRSVFFDKIHPSATLHAILGHYVLDLLTPPALTSLLDGAPAGRIALASDETPGRSGAGVAAVPLPAPTLLLLSALAGLGWAGRRAQARALRSGRAGLLGATLAFPSAAA